MTLLGQGAVEVVGRLLRPLELPARGLARAHVRAGLRLVLALLTRGDRRRVAEMRQPAVQAQKLAQVGQRMQQDVVEVPCSLFSALLELAQQPAAGGAP